MLHHVTAGLAMEPEFNPMYGPDAVSEQGWPKALIARLPPNSILIGDRNFGVFPVVWNAHSRGCLVLAEGRWIVSQPQGASELLYLFTMLDVPSSEVAALYKERWNGAFACPPALI